MAGNEEGVSLTGVKFLFIAMILILIGGALFLFVTIHERNQGKNSTSACEESLDVTLAGTVKELQKEGDTLVLLIEDKKGIQKIILMDDCRAQVRRTITLHPKNS